MHVSEGGVIINIPPMGGVISEGKQRLSSSVIRRIQTREINTERTDAPNGTTPRPTDDIDDMVVFGGDPAEVSEGEAHRATVPLSWKTPPADFLTIGGNEIQDAVPEETKEGL